MTVRLSDRNYKMRRRESGSRDRVKRAAPRLLISGKGRRRANDSLVSSYGQEEASKDRRFRAISSRPEVGISNCYNIYEIRLARYIPNWIYLNWNIFLVQSILSFCK